MVMHWFIPLVIIYLLYNNLYIKSDRSRCVKNEKRALESSHTCSHTDGFVTQAPTENIQNTDTRMYVSTSAKCSMNC